VELYLHSPSMLSWHGAQVGKKHRDNFTPTGSPGFAKQTMPYLSNLCYNGKSYLSNIFYNGSLVT